MTYLRLLADMNISPKTVDALRQRGWDIIRVSEILPMDAEDEEILDLARREGRVVITQDLDFSALLALGGYDRPSLVTFRGTISKAQRASARGGGAGFRNPRFEIRNLGAHAHTDDRGWAEGDRIQGG